MNHIIELVQLARLAREKAQAIYSDFKVGAVVRTKSGKVFTGSNIESSSYGLTICAERVAIFKAISEGELDIEEIAVIADTKNVVSPCGACRQIMIDYAENAQIYLANIDGKHEITSTKKLLPNYFNKESLL